MTTSEEHEHSDQDGTEKNELMDFLRDIEPETRNDILESVSECCDKRENAEASIWFAQIMLSTSIRMDDKISALRAYNRLALLHRKYGKIDESLLYFKKTREKYREFTAIENKFRGKRHFEVSVIEREALLNLSILYRDMEQYDQAGILMKEYFSRLNLIEQDKLIEAYHLLGDVESLQGRYEDAIRSFRIQLALCMQYNDKNGLAMAYSSIGKVFLKCFDVLSANEWFQLSLRALNTSGEKDYLCAKTYKNFGEALLNQNNPRQALFYFEKTLKIAIDIRERMIGIEAMHEIGRCYKCLGIFKQSEFFLKRALLECQGSGMLLEDKIKEDLAGMLLAVGRFNEGLKILYELRNHLESKLEKLSQLKLVTKNPLFKRLNVCIAKIVNILVDKARIVEAFEVAEKGNSLILKQMLDFRTRIGFVEMTFDDLYTNLDDLYKIVRARNKVVLYYKILNNGFIVWVIGPSQDRPKYYRHSAPCSSPFGNTIASLINGLLTRQDRLANYDCDHRKTVDSVSGFNTVNKLRCSSSHLRSLIFNQISASPTDLGCSDWKTNEIFQNDLSPYTLKSKYIDSLSSQGQAVEDDRQRSAEAAPNTPSLACGKNCLQKLSELLIFPIEKMLTEIPDLNVRDLVIVSNSFLRIVPFSDLLTSHDKHLTNLVNSVQILPCVSVLKLLELNCNITPKGIAVIGNPDENFQAMRNILKRKPQPDFMEKELNDVAILLGSIPDVGARASKENFQRKFCCSNLIHVAAYASLDEGTITFAPIPEIDPRVMENDARDPWEINLEDILAFRSAPDVVVLSSGYGCRHHFNDINAFGTHLPLALMLAGVKSVVMTIWTTPQIACLTFFREFYKNISNNMFVSRSLVQAKDFIKGIDMFNDPVNWASFQVYGRDCLLDVEELRRREAETSFVEAQKLAVERFAIVGQRKESSDAILYQRSLEMVHDLLLKHHLQPKLLQILLQVLEESLTILNTSPSNENSKKTVNDLPYREIFKPWLSLVLQAEKFLLSLGFLVKSIETRQTVLVYPHWNRNNYLEKVQSLLQSVQQVVDNSPVLSDALRVVLIQEDKCTLIQLQNLRFRKELRVSNIQCCQRQNSIQDGCNTDLARMKKRRDASLPTGALYILVIEKFDSFLKRALTRYPFPYKYA
ncbi:tetratricopeptide repeat protein 28-like isoform X2 [Xenia sp. Carnegie-2017]|uniref:tetratricopeptide repeat protein 28-like isoform X2 n=1 Tax=Xenia sp. Carnegie-2017 TaxID=2897299 RepID=UPI001F04D92A|nr:tetratricopeptide repeat protein 28-like isoform X2 [Xenia sp. Carnegie-2017]